MSAAVQLIRLGLLLSLLFYLYYEMVVVLRLIIDEGTGPAYPRNWWENFLFATSDIHVCYASQVIFLYSAFLSLGVYLRVYRGGALARYLADILDTCILLVSIASILLVTMSLKKALPWMLL